VRWVTLLQSALPTAAEMIVLAGGDQVAQSRRVET
jgi:hypothetical protein